MKVVEEIRADAARLIAADEVFGLIDAADLPVEVWGPGFGPLVHLILGQQVSIEAADTMYANLEQATRGVTPQSLLALEDAAMRACGFTRMKAEYARDLARSVLDGFDLDGLEMESDDSIVASLTQLRGIGLWTAECYLLFCLGRRDVFPASDMALRVGYQELMGKALPPTEAEVRRQAMRWAPRRTAAAYLVWQGYLERRGRS